MEGPTAGLSQQSGEAEGTLILEVQVRVGSSPENDGTCQYCQIESDLVSRRLLMGTPGLVRGWGRAAGR